MSDSIQPYKGWTLVEDPYEDGDRFERLWSEAHHESGRRQILHVSDFTFRMNQARFNWFVDNDFPLPPGKGPWSSDAVDREIARAKGS